MGLEVISMTRYEEIYAGKQVCCTCIHFYQHYGKGKKKYHLVDCGHCCYPRLKTRKTDQTCEHWKGKKREPVSDS